MSQTKLVTKNGGDITNKIPKDFFYNPEYSIRSQNRVTDLGQMDTKTREWFLTNLSQNDIASWAKDYQLKVRSLEVPY